MSRKYLWGCLAVLILSLPYAGWVSAQESLHALTGERANLRSGPGREYPILLELPPNTPLILEGRSRSSGWALVQTEAQTQGWVLASALILERGVSLDLLAVSTVIFTNSDTALGQGMSNDPDRFVRYAARFSPEMYQTMLRVSQHGIKNGVRLNVFSAAGDCHVGDDWFMEFYKDGRAYDLGEFKHLKRVLDYYTTGSFLDPSQAQGGGFSSVHLIDPSWADPKVCNAHESPLACEIRVNRPAVLIIEVGLIDSSVGITPALYSQNLNRVLDETLSAGIIPILSTVPERPQYRLQAKALNQTIRRIAEERGVALIDLAAAIDDLPRHGIDQDGMHLSPGDAFQGADFHQMDNGFTVWNYLVLESLYKVMSILETAQDQSIRDTLDHY